MKIRRLFQLFSVIVACLLVITAPVAAQRPGSHSPREEKLLNGLKLLMWNDKSAKDVKVSVRIHSGAAFDPQGKEGVMELLSRSIFPTELSREYFTDDLGGSVEVVTNYDYIQINASAEASNFLKLFETVAQAVSNVTVDKETTEAVKKSLSERLAVLEKDPAYIVDRATAQRLFGTFPYGRPALGSVESLQGIDFADLLFAKERFFSADNATVTIVGNFNSDLGYRAARRFFGAWLKSDKRVPSTFRQPDAPDTSPAEIIVEGAEPRSSFALRGLAKNDPDYNAALVLEKILQTRSARLGATAVVSHEAHVLPGVVLVKMTGSSPFPFKIFDRISDAEFVTARAAVVADLAKRPLTARWLDADTYRVKVSDDAAVLGKVTLADVQRVAERLSKNPIVSVIASPPSSAN